MATSNNNNNYYIITIINDYLGVIMGWKRNEYNENEGIV